MAKKIGVLLASSLLVAALWYAGLEGVYARVLVFATNTILDISGSEATLSLVLEDGERVFRVRTRIDGQWGTYPQRLQSLLLPTVMVFAWQLFSAFFIGRKRALRTSGINIGLFIFFHIIFLLLLTGYYTSGTAHFFYIIFMDSFYIIGLLIILIDNIRNPVFMLPGQARQPATQGQKDQP
jgi:hypothetical protein